MVENGAASVNDDDQGVFFVPRSTYIAYFS